MILIALNQVNVSVKVDLNLAQVEKTCLYVIGNDIELKVLFQVIITIKIKFSELLLITVSTIKSGTFGLVMVTCTISMLSCFSLCLKCVEPLVLILILILILIYLSLNTAFVVAASAIYCARKLVRCIFILILVLSINPYCNLFHIYLVFMFIEIKIRYTV